HAVRDTTSPATFGAGEAPWPLRGLGSSSFSNPSKEGPRRSRPQLRLQLLYPPPESSYLLLEELPIDSPRGGEDLKEPYQLLGRLVLRKPGIGRRSPLKPLLKSFVALDQPEAGGFPVLLEEIQRSHKGLKTSVVLEEALSGKYWRSHLDLDRLVGLRDLLKF